MYIGSLYIIIIICWYLCFIWRMENQCFKSFRTSLMSYRHSDVLRRNYTKTGLPGDGISWVPKSVGVKINILFNLRSLVGRGLVLIPCLIRVDTESCQFWQFVAAQELRITCDSQSPTNYSCWRFVSLIVLHKMLKQQSTWPYAAGYLLPSTPPWSSCFPHHCASLYSPIQGVSRL